MKLSQRRAVSPIIATLLLIAIAVASGVIVYVFTSGLAGNLTKSGGIQVTEQISMDAYSYQSPPTLTLYLRNTGTGTINMTTFYFDGNLYAPVAGLLTVTGGSICAIHTNSGTPTSAVCAPGQTVILHMSEASTSGQAHAVKIATADGAQATFNVVAGQTG